MYVRGKLGRAGAKSGKCRGEVASAERPRGLVGRMKFLKAMSERQWRRRRGQRNGKKKTQKAG